MIKPAMPINEEDRLKALKSFGLLDSGHEEIFDNFVKLASEVCECKISTISLVDSNRQWFKSKIGLEDNETSRDISFCGHGILENDIFEVENAVSDIRFNDNPLVTGNLNIRFYAGAQLKTSNGHSIGMICVIDDQPKKLNNFQREMLKNIAKQIMLTIEMRSHLQNLENESARVDFIVKNAGVGTWDWNLETNNVHFDERWCGMLGRTVDERPQKLETWDMLVHPDDRDQSYIDKTKHINGETVIYENVHRLKHKNGEWVWILDKGFITQRDQNGKPIRFSGIHIDITKPKNEEQLHQKILVLREFFIKNWESRKTFFDFLLLEIMQLTESEYGFIGEIKHAAEGVPYLKTFSITDISWDDETRKFFALHAAQGLEFRNLNTLFGEVIKTGVPLITNNAPSHPKANGIPKGHPPLNKFLGIPIHYNGKYLAMVGVANARTDYSEKKLNDYALYFEVLGELIQNFIYREEIRQKQNEAHHESKLVSLGTLAAGIGHEINNPLTIIRGNLDRLLKRIDRQEVNDEFLLKIQSDMSKALMRVENLIKGLRTFSRKDTLTSENINATDLLNETMDMLYQIYKSDGIILERKFHIDPATTFYIDRGKIQQVFVNLLNNARDSLEGRPGAKINVTTKIENSKLLILVEDNGAGIPKELQEKIFDPFFTTKEVNKGTGLGLSVVADIMRLHEAKINFHSSEEGTTFFLEFSQFKA